MRVILLEMLCLLLLIGAYLVLLIKFIRGDYPWTNLFALIQIDWRDGGNEIVPTDVAIKRNKYVLSQKQSITPVYNLA